MRTSIVCVDDERIVLNGLKDQLRRHFGSSIEIEIAESGEEGLEVFEELRVAGVSVPLVISDQLMPGMKGEAFLEAIHNVDARILSILLTGQATAEAVGAAVNRAKLYRFVGKPWAEDDLMMTVREALRTFAQAREIERQNEELNKAHAASLRFVPREFLRMLGHEQLVDIRYGEHIVREVSILFSDMRGFTTLVEGKTPGDAFFFVNEYIQRMEEPIRAHGGFINNIEGDALLALFPGTPDQAVRAGVESHSGLRELNERRRLRGEPPIRMGLGVHTGTLLLGVVGGGERLQCDVVGDPANLSARIEGLTKHYDTAMLISGDTQNQLTQPLRLRQVDYVRAKGKQRPVTLYEVLDALPEEDLQRKLTTSKLFSEALAAFRAGKIKEALAGFEAVLAKHPEDGAARLHAGRCSRMKESALPADWDGTVSLDFK
jgi:adenylate cyclase